MCKMIILCSIEGCSKKVKTSDLCAMHYKRWCRHGDPHYVEKKHGEALKWVESVAMDFIGDDCLPWPFNKNGSGYGTVWLDGKKVLASRMICERAHGKPPTTHHEAAHSCGKGHEGCVNPAHLIWKTPKENQADRIGHGTDNRGMKNHSTKLSDNDIRHIRSLNATMSQVDIALMFGVTQASISRIISGKAWGWLDDYAYPDPVNQAIKEAKRFGSPFVCEAVA